MAHTLIARSGPPDAAEARLRVLIVLGQKPAFTGSGILVQALWRCAAARGDEQFMVCGGYQGDDWSSAFGPSWEQVTFSSHDRRGDVPFPIPGMSDVMPYESTRYADLSSVQVNAMLGSYAAAVRRARRLFRPQVVHLHHLWVLTGLEPELRGLPAVITVHGTDLKLAAAANPHRALVRQHLGLPRKLLCVSRSVARDAIEEYNVTADRITVIPNGFDGAVFCRNGPAAEWTGRVVLCAGKFVPWKGFRYALRASTMVRQPHTLVVAGAGNADETSMMVSEAERLGVRLLLVGHLSQERLAAWMRRANVFVLPSVHEPFGLVLLEAMACGCRVVAGGSGGPADIVSNSLQSQGLARLVTPLGSDPMDEERYVAALARAIESYLLEEPSEVARDEVSASVADLTWAAVYEKVRHEYLQLTAQRP